jgi:Glycosyltransferases involved in cell wall biogenesis
MESYLVECLDSVFSQTLKDIEVICVNDGSTDHSSDILKDYSDRHDNLIVIEQENAGVSAARNNAIDIAKGEFIAFMDPDDYYPEMDILESIYMNAVRNEVLICGGSLSSFRGEATTQIIAEYYGRWKNYTFSGNHKVCYEDYQYCFGFQRFIYQADFLRENGIKFPYYARFQDPPFFVQAMVNAGEFYAMEKITYCYRASHKNFISSFAPTLDYTMGIIDLLTISRAKRLSKLHTIAVEIMHDDLSAAVYKYVADGYEKFIELVRKINDIIDIHLIEPQSRISNTPYLKEPNTIIEFVMESPQREAQLHRVLREYSKVIIFGAGKVGVILFEYLQNQGYNEIYCFAVTDNSNNPLAICGIPVKEINSLLEYRSDALILIATFANHHRDIINMLDELQFQNVLPIFYNELQLYKSRS